MTNSVVLGDKSIDFVIVLAEVCCKYETSWPRSFLRWCPAAQNLVYFATIKTSFKIREVETCQWEQAGCLNGMIFLMETQNLHPASYIPARLHQHCPNIYKQHQDSSWEEKLLQRIPNSTGRAVGFLRHKAAAQNSGNPGSQPPRHRGKQDEILALIKAGRTSACQPAKTCHTSFDDKRQTQYPQSQTTSRQSGEL